MTRVWPTTTRKRRQTDSARSPMPVSTIKAVNNAPIEEVVLVLQGREEAQRRGYRGEPAEAGHPDPFGDGGAHAAGPCGGEGRLEDAAGSDPPEVVPERAEPVAGPCDDDRPALTAQGSGLFVSGCGRLRRAPIGPRPGSDIDQDRPALASNRLAAGKACKVGGVHRAEDGDDEPARVVLGAAGELGVRAGLYDGQGIEQKLHLDRTTDATVVPVRVGGLLLAQQPDHELVAGQVGSDRRGGRNGVLERRGWARAAVRRLLGCRAGSWLGSGAAAPRAGPSARRRVRSIASGSGAGRRRAGTRES